MSNSDAIRKAIAAHGMWKARLRNAIKEGKSEFTPERVATDNQCDFGKWLHSLPAADRQGDEWKKVRDLHATFHKEAGQVLQLALGGQKAAAEDNLTPNSAFAKTSVALTSAMMAWEKKAA